MARSHAKILVAVWRDPEWVSLTARAQWLYVLLLSQPKLTLVGSLDVTVPKWAALAAGVTTDDVAGALMELHDARFVIHDEPMGELLIRSFTSHDLDSNRLNSNLVKGLWGQWACISSPLLRSAAVLGMPDAVWAKAEAHAPIDAVKIRRSARLEPTAHGRLEPGSHARIEPPPSSLLPPVTCLRPAEGVPVAADFEHHPSARIDEQLVAQGRSAVVGLRDRFQHRDPLSVSGLPDPRSGDALNSRVSAPSAALTTPAKDGEQ